MSEDLLSRISFVDYEDYGSLLVKRVEGHEGNLFVYLDVSVDEDADLPKSIRIGCKGYLESNLSPGAYVTLEPSQDHVLLWHYNQPQVLTTFHGKVSEPLLVVGALFEQHTDLVEDWIPFSKYFNTDLSLSELLGGTFGLLAEGPEQLIVAYEKVLNGYGVSVSHHKSSEVQNENVAVMLFVWSYFILKRILAQAI